MNRHLYYDQVKWLPLLHSKIILGTS